MALSLSSMILSIGSTPLGQTSTHCIHLVQSQIPPSWSFKFFNLSLVFESLGSSTNLHALASAAGPIKLSSTSRTVQSDTQQPHIIQFIEVSKFSIDSFDAIYSPFSGTWSG